MAFDLQAIGVDLRDLWRDGSTLTPRWVLFLAGHLDDSSALHASLRGGREFRPWTLQNSLLAGAVNQLFAANRQRAGKKPGKPPVQPPTAKKKTRTVHITDLAQLQALTTTE